MSPRDKPLVWFHGEIKMDEKKRKRLEAVGWKTGSAYDFLEMTEEEALCDSWGQRSLRP